MVDKRQTIVAAILMNASRNRVLLSCRKDDVHMGGCWEYPGGKLEPGESPWQALKRELHEELGIDVQQGHHFKTLEYDYPDRKISLSTWNIAAWTGKPSGREGQSIRWFDISSLHELRFPDANAYVTRLVQLPELYLITPDHSNYDDSFMQTVDSLLENGLKLLQFRSPSSPATVHNAVVRRLINLCEPRGCRVLYNGAPEEAMRLGAHGVHLNSKRLMALSGRPLPADMWVAASCHTSAELEHAAAINSDFCVLSPIRHTASHPGASPLGWAHFAGIIRNGNLPVYALGGIRSGDLQQAREVGAKGVSVISAIWNAVDPGSVMKSL